MITVKLTIPGLPSCPDLFMYTGSELNIVDGCKFFLNDPKTTQADVWIVVDDLDKFEYCHIPVGHAVFVGAEVLRSPDFCLSNPGREFLAQFSQVHTWLATSHPGLVRALPFQAWMINSNHGSFFGNRSERDINWLSKVHNLDKPFEISVICSDNMYTPVHRVRLAFVQALKESLGERLHWFGNGINSIDQKWDGLAPYKYHICIENQRGDDVITEKLIDPFLSLTFPFYWGAPNTDCYFPSSAFCPIDITNISDSVRLIHRLLDENPYLSRLQDLKEARDCVLNEYNFLRRMARLAQSLYNDHGKSHSFAPVCLDPLRMFNAPQVQPNLASRLRHRVLRLLN